MHAFWMGGACAPSGVIPPQPLPGGGYRFPIPPDLRNRYRKRRRDEDDMLMALLLASMPGLLRRH